MLAKEGFTKYEVARILGARALQIAMDAPLLLKITEEELDKINYDPLKISEKEFESEVLPITVKRPFPKRKEVKVKKSEEETKKEEEKSEEELKKEDKEIEEKEKQEEKEIMEKGEIMELAKPIDEAEEENSTEEKAI